MEKTILLIITLFALYYIYKSTFKESSCNCGEDGCCSSKKGKNG